MPRALLIALIAASMFACTISAAYALSADHVARGLSTFFAGTTMSLLIWSLSRRRSR